MYQLIISPATKKQLKLIKQTHQLAIQFALQDIKENPSSGQPLTMGLAGRRSYRIGVYRIIYKINEKEERIYILNAGHRSTIYQ